MKIPPSPPFSKGGIILLISIFLFSCAHQRKPVRISDVIHKETPEEKMAAETYLHFLKSDYYSLAGDHEKAFDEFEPVIAANPDNAYLYYELATKELDQKHFEEAFAACEKALSLSPNLMPAKLLLGRLYSMQGKNAEAVNIYEEALRSSQPKNEIYSLLVREYIALKRYNEAAGAMHRLLAAETDSSTAYYYLGMIYSTYLKQYDKAISAYQKILESYPSDIQIHAAIVQIYLDQKQTKKALDKLLVMEAMAPDDFSILLKTALIYYDLKEYGKSAERFEKILTANPESDKIRYYLGVVYISSGKLDEAIKHFALVPVKSSFYKDANLQIAQFYLNKGQITDAAKAMEHALHNKVDEPVFYQFLAIIYEKLGDMEKVIGALEKGVAALPSDEKVAFSLAIMYDKQKLLNKAVEMMKKVVTLNPKNASALNYVGYTYAERGENLDEAEDMLQEAVSLKPDDGYIVDSLGWLYFKKGDYTKAYELLKRSARLVPKEPTVFEHLGDLLKILRNDAKEALRMYKKALQFSKQKKEPDVEEIKRLEGKVCEAGGC